jgi:hypothetical protein
MQIAITLRDSVKNFDKCVKSSVSSTTPGGRFAIPGNNALVSQVKGNHQERAKMKLISQLTLAGLLSVITTNSIAADPSSANYRMRWDVLDSGGGVSASTNYQMTGSIQSTAIGQSSSTNYKMTAGFQSVPDTDADSVRDFLDNCTLVANTNQTNADSDLDIFGNACDADLKGDGFVYVSLWMS